MYPPIKLSIFSKPGKLFFKGCFLFYAKKFARKLLKIKRGPDVVFESLIRGLNSQQFPFNVNPDHNQIAETVHVLSNVSALEWAVQLKKTGKIKTIVAGPNMSILPTYDNQILCRPEIDMILLPSQWTKDAYIQSAPVLSSKIKVWPAGVVVPKATVETNQISKSRSLFVVFKKTFDESQFKQIISYLNNAGIQHKILEYGSFKQNEYLELLSTARAMIYLQKAESQGIALQEAWAANVPTLVWNSKSFTYPNTDITVHGPVSAPYLNEKSGMFFDSIEEFPNKLNEFIEKIDTFTARQYCIDNLSDDISAKIYINQVFANSSNNLSN